MLDVRDVGGGGEGGQESTSRVLILELMEK